MQTRFFGRQGVGLVLLLGLGCSVQQPSPAPVEPTDELRPARTPTTFTHDFGVIAPEQLVSHAFPITNTSAETWTFARFQSTCGCTVGGISTETVIAGDTALVTVRYRAPAAVGDDRRAVELYFHEASAPAFRLEVAAKARRPLTVLPTALLFPHAPGDRAVTTKLVVANYSSADVPPPRFVSPAPWVKLGDARPEPPPADDPAVRQQWSIPVILASDAATPGDHETVITPAPDVPHREGIAVPVRMTVLPPLETSPSQLFFGAVSPGRPATVTVTVRVPRGAAADDIACEHDLGPQFDLRRTLASDSTVRYAVTLTPASGATGEVRGFVTVRCGPTGRPARLPVLARVTADVP